MQSDRGCDGEKKDKAKNDVYEIGVDKILTEINKGTNWMDTPASGTPRFTPKIVPRADRSKRTEPESKVCNKNIQDIKHSKSKPEFRHKKEIQLSASGPFSLGPAPKTSHSIPIIRSSEISTPPTQLIEETFESTTTIPTPSSDIPDTLQDLYVDEKCPIAPLTIVKTTRNNSPDHNLGDEPETVSNVFSSDNPEPILMQFPDFINFDTIDDLANNTSTPSHISETTPLNSQHKIGYLYIHKSGNVQMRLGDLTLDTHSVPSPNYYQTAAIINKHNKTCKFVSDVKNKLIITPSASHCS